MGNSSRGFRLALALIFYVPATAHQQTAASVFRNSKGENEISFEKKADALVNVTYTPNFESSGWGYLVIDSPPAHDISDLDTVLSTYRAAGFAVSHQCQCSFNLCMQLVALYEGVNQNYFSRYLPCRKAPCSALNLSSSIPTSTTVNGGDKLIIRSFLNPLLHLLVFIC